MEKKKKKGMHHNSFIHVYISNTNPTRTKILKTGRPEKAELCLMSTVGESYDDDNNIYI